MVIAGFLNHEQYHVNVTLGAMNFPWWSLPSSSGHRSCPWLEDSNYIVSKSVYNPFTQFTTYLYRIHWHSPNFFEVPTMHGWIPPWLIRPSRPSLTNRAPRMATSKTPRSAFKAASDSAQRHCWRCNSVWPRQVPGRRNPQKSMGRRYIYLHLP